MGESFCDRQVVDAVHRMIGYRHSADYYLSLNMLGHHTDLANAAEDAYREADTRLQDLGVTDNRQRQAIIHGVHILRNGWR